METGGSISVLSLLIFLILATIVVVIIWRYGVKKNKTAVPRAENSSAKEQLPKNNTIETIEKKGSDSYAIEQKDIEASPKIFISYRRADSVNSTGRIYDRLVQKFGAQNVFKDVDSIPLGVDFRMHLNNVLSKTNVSLVVIGSQWLGKDEMEKEPRLFNPSDFVRVEIETALERNIPVIPLLVEDAKMPLKDDLPDTLKTLVYRNGISIRPDPDFHNDINRLMKAITHYIN